MRNLPPSMPGYDAHARERLARTLKAEAARLGFDACGIAEARRLDEEAARLEQWLLEGRHASMGWMERHFEKRVDPRRLVEGARSVISVLESYYQPAEHGAGEGVGKISRYAWGTDYHQVLKEKLFRLYQWLQEHVGNEIHGRAFVDSAPVMDKAWAQKSGLGWQGKHTNLISRDAGSFFFIGELIVDVPLAPDDPFTGDYCGSCTRCLDACPTDALYEPYALDASRCISYLTIEHGPADGEIPEGIQPYLHHWIFGCDICQDVCPWNKFAKETHEARYLPRESLTDTDLHEWAEVSLEAFEERFKDSPVRRATFEGFKRNARRALNALRANRGNGERGKRGAGETENGRDR